MPGAGPAGLVQAAREAEEILHNARRSRTRVKTEMGVGRGGWLEDRAGYHGGGGVRRTNDKFDLFAELHRLYDELGRDDHLHSAYQGLRSTSYLLEKLMARVNLNTLIVNLYPGNKGYSLSLRVNGTQQDIHPTDGMDGGIVESARWPYEEEELLSYIDNEELPVVLLDLLEQEHSSLFYSGCIVAQVRDYRHAYPSLLCDTHHVLLKPSNQSIITDVNSVSAGCGLGSEERAALEAAMVLATAPPLCLDPRPAVGLLAARLHSAPRLLNTPYIRRQARRFSQVFVNRKRKLEAWTRVHGLDLLELVNKQRARHHTHTGARHSHTHHTLNHDRLTSKYPKRPSEVLKGAESAVGRVGMEWGALAMPTEIGAPLRLARPFERPRHSLDCHPQLVEEYVLETERGGSGGYFHIKLSILQRPADHEYLGELYVDRDHVEGQNNGAACRFTLGSRHHANKYIQQFTEIFTEEGRKCVRIKHLVPGQLPRVSFTPGMREMQNQQQLVLQQRPSSTTSAPTLPTVTTATSTTSVVTSQAPTQTAAPPAARSLPILAQLAGVGAVAGVAGVGGTAVVGGVAGNAVDAMKQQHSPGVALRQSPQMAGVSSVGSADMQPVAASSNQLLAAQLTNPPQPLNPSKPSAVLHIQHPHRIITSQAGMTSGNAGGVVVGSGSGGTGGVQRPRTTNPAISALVTSLMNSAHQFQQQANQNAGKCIVSSAAGSNATILNLLNSAPAAMTHPTPSHTHRQVMGGYTTSEDGSSSGGGGMAVSSEGSLLERLIASGGAGGGGEAGEAESTQAQQSQPQSQPQALHLQGLSLASLQGLSGLGSLGGMQNVQVQIPGLSAPISLSLNVSGAPGGLLVSVPPTTSVVLSNQPSVLSLPIAQLMSSGVKGGVRGGVQLVRARSPATLPALPPRAARPLHLSTTTPSAVSHTSLPNISSGAQFVSSVTAAGLQQQLRRKSNPPTLAPHPSPGPTDANPH